jgi:hypothetical protein
MRIVHLEIRTWVGTSIGAIHTYGKLVFKDGGIHPQERDLYRAMTTKEIREYNAEMIAQGYKHLKAEKGKTTVGFKDEGEVIKCAIQTSKENWPDGNFLLLKGDHCTYSAMPVLYAPESFTEATRINELAEQWEKIERASRYKQGYPKELDTIDNEFNAIIERAKTHETKKTDEATGGISARGKTKVPVKDKAHI